MTGNGPIVARPAATLSESATCVRPARSPRTVATPLTVVLKRRITFQPVEVLRTSGEPIAERAAVVVPPPPPPVAFELKFAVTVWAVVSFTVHVVFAPEHAPLQPRNDCPADGLAASVTEAPALKCWMQVLLGPMAVHAPAVVETVPLPPTLIVSVPGVPPPVKVAETFFALVIDTEHVVAVPAHEPPQPANFAPEAGVAVSVTLDPWVTCALHAADPLPQLIVPPVTFPGPETETVSGTCAVPPVKVADTLTDAVMVKVQVVAVPEPAQAPPHPANVAPPAGVAVRVTTVPAGRPELVARGCAVSAADAGSGDRSDPTYAHGEREARWWSLSHR